MVVALAVDPECFASSIVLFDAHVGISALSSPADDADVKPVSLGVPRVPLGKTPIARLLARRVDLGELQTASDLLEILDLESVVMNTLRRSTRPRLQQRHVDDTVGHKHAWSQAQDHVHVEHVMVELLKGGGAVAEDCKVSKR